MRAASLDLTSFTVALDGETDFAGWRDAARRLVLNGIAPEDIAWAVRAEEAIDDPQLPLSLEAPSPSRAKSALDTSPPVPEGEDGRLILDSDASPDDDRANLGAHPLPLEGGEVPSEARRRGGGLEHPNPLPPIPPGAELKVPKEFVERAKTVICHSDPQRFAFLYRLLWRLRAEPDLLKIASDPDIRRFESMEKAVRRDIHKMRAFVRFRKAGEGDLERYVAWFEPGHYIVERNAAFFVRRFTGMRWTILTPHASADWDGERLAIGPGADKRDAPTQDTTEDLWRTYYTNIFNPARLKVNAMRKEMPKKYWRNLPEAPLIPEMIATAGEAAREMIARMPTVPAPHHAKIQARHWPTPPADTSDPDLGADAASIGEARDAASGCKRCPLWRDATQTVFGEGPETARFVFVGEQPGDQEDIAGKPFVGPAGKVFDGVVEEAGIDRSLVYVTNAVKHFKFEPRGKRRIHAKPNAGEISACRWWLDKELSFIKPDLAIALGATAAQSLLGKAVAVTRMRGRIVERDDGLRVFITIHPSFILRIQDRGEAAAERDRFVADLKAVKRMMGAA